MAHGAKVSLHAALRKSRKRDTVSATDGKFRQSSPMYTRTVSLSLLGAYAALVTSIAHADERDYWNVKADHFRCVLNNLEVYAAQPQKTVVIFTESCPEADISKLFSKSVQNNALPAAERTDDSEQKPAEVIVFSKEGLMCLKGQTIPENLDILKIPKNPCS